MAQKKVALLNISKAIAGISFTTLAAIGSATGNLEVAGLLAVPAASLAALEALWPQLQTQITSSEGQLRLPLPDWWNSDHRSWEGVCAEIEQAFPVLLQDMGQRLGSFQGVITQETVRIAFREALIAHHLTWATSQETRRRIAEEIATPILAKLAQVLQPLIEELQKETLLRDTHTNAQNTQAIATITAQMLDVLKDLRQGGTRPKDEKELQTLKERYFDSIRQRFEYMDLGGISPRVTSKAETRIISIRMEDVFVPLQARKERQWGAGSSDGAYAAGLAIGLIAILAGIYLLTRATDTTRSVFRTFPEELSQHQQGSFSSQADNTGAEEDDKEAGEEELDEEALREQLRALENQPSDEWETVGLAKILEHRKAVILGHPGAGKSTLAKYVAYAIAQGKTDLIGEDLGAAIPLVVKAAEYGKFLRKDASLSCYRYVGGKHHTDHFGALFEWALKTNQCLVIIDGLDEVPDPVLRGRVAAKIEEFVSEYPENRFLVTSRIVGYQETQLTGKFTHFQLTEWQSDQIVQYLEHWYLAVAGSKLASLEAAYKEQAQQLWDAIAENEGIKKLAGTPLLLTIIALVNYYGGKLPDRRIEVYQFATETLLSNWPLKHREQRLDARELLLILEPIAYHIFTTSADRLITEYEFRPLFEEQVRRVRGTSPRQTRKMSIQLLEQIAQHTGFFLSRGLNEQGQEVYGFLHPTFAEYLTARYLAQKWVEEEYQLAFAPFIHEAGWHEVVLLIAGHLGTMMPIFPTKLVEQIEQLSPPYESYLHRNLLLIAKMLGEKVPVAREKMDAIVAQMIALALQTTFPPLWANLLKRLGDITTAFPFAELPKQLKPQKGELLYSQVRKTLVARSMGFHKEADIDLFYQGLFESEETALLAQSALSKCDELKKGVPSHVLCFEADLGGSYFGIPQRIAERLSRLQAPAITVGKLAEAGWSRERGTRQVWFLDLRQLAQLWASFEELGNQAHGAWRRRDVVLGALTWNQRLLNEQIPEWVKHVIEKTSDADDQISLTALEYLEQDWRQLRQISVIFDTTDLRRAMSNLCVASSASKVRAKALKLWFLFESDVSNRVDALLQTVDDHDPTVRATAAEMVFQVDLGPTLPKLLAEKLRNLLMDDNGAVRCGSARSLIRRGAFEEEEVPSLLERVFERGGEQRSESNTALLMRDLICLANQTKTAEQFLMIGEYFKRLLESEVKSDMDFEPLYSKAAAHTRGSWRKTILSLLKSQEVAIRRNAALAFKWMDQKDWWLSHLVPLLQDNDDSVRLAALQVLWTREINEPDVREALLDLAKGKKSPDNFVALEILGMRSNLEDEVEFLLETLGGEDQVLARVAAYALANVKDATIRQRIVEEAGRLIARQPDNIFAYSVLWYLLVPVDAIRIASSF